MATPPRRALLYGGLLLHTALCAGSYLWGKSALREIPPLPLGLLRFLGASALLALMLLRVRPPGQRLPPRSAWPRLLLLVTTHGPLAVIAWTLIAGTAMYLPLGIASLAAPGAVHRIAHASRAAWLGVAYLILVTSVVAYLLWYWALAHLPAARVAVFTNLQPLATAVLAHFFLGEHVTPQFVGGALVVISGVVLAQLRAPRTASEVPPEPA